MKDDHKTDEPTQCSNQETAAMSKSSCLLSIYIYITKIIIGSGSNLLETLTNQKSRNKTIRFF